MHRPESMLAIGGMGLRYGAQALGDLQKMVRRVLQDERLQQALSFQSLYLGLSPYDSLAIYCLLAVHRDGGRHLTTPWAACISCARALERLARELGVELRLPGAGRSPGAGGRHGARRGPGRRDPGERGHGRGQCRPAVRLRHLLRRALSRNRAEGFSCSVVLLYLGVNRTYPQLLHHNLAVGARPARDLSTISSCEHRMPDDPPFYLVASTRTDPSQAPPGCENLFVLVLAPSQRSGAPDRLVRSRGRRSRRRRSSGWRRSGSPISGSTS